MGEIKYHIGCGKRDFGEGWFNVDGETYPHIDSNDIYLTGLAENSIDLIYASHLIAYFDREEIGVLLRSWFKVLRPGGVLRLATPDFEKLREIYLVTGLIKILGPLYGKMKMGSDFIYHKNCYDFKDLSELLYSIGFKNVWLYDHTKTEHPNTGNRNDKYDDHSAAYINGYLISLNVECNKP